MDLTRREIATVVLVISIAMVGIGVWMQHRRQYQLMPSLVSPMALVIFGGSIALIAFVAAIVPAR